MNPAVLTVAAVGREPLTALLARYGLSLDTVPATEDIPGSFWGDREAGVSGLTVFVRDDTPLHSVLHETAHVVCMDPVRRKSLHRDAGGDAIEEAAVCYLQLLLADEIPGAGRERLMRDMDTWGYSFRLGSTRVWFERDADDALDWLERHGLVEAGRRPSFRLRC